MVKRAGSGHLGSSFSAMDIVTYLYYSRLNTVRVGLNHPDRDVYFSSKGHDVPGLYSVLFSLGILPQEKIMSLRRLGGLDGHPDVKTVGIEANSGSLGMGISKGKGIALAKKLNGNSGHVYVLIGDGELQEGQNFEAFQSAAHHHVGGLTVIVDHNKLQSDRQVQEIVGLGDLEKKFAAFGWRVARCDGHDFNAIAKSLDDLQTATNTPKILICDTIKGRGVSFMEHPFALEQEQGFYKWHSGAPADADFIAGHREIIEKIQVRLKSQGVDSVRLEEVKPEIQEIIAAPKEFLVGESDSQGKAISLKASSEFVADAFGEALLKLGSQHKNLVVLDADLSADCRLRKFEVAYPERFFEIGIAEQDMVSTAGGMARHGLLPVVNSFASFLASRANEQIYNNATEMSKIIYVCHFGGLVPAGPGKSHQSIRDISLFGALPNMTIIQPCNSDEMFQTVRYCIENTNESCMIRLNIGPSPRRIQLAANYQLELGKGVVLTEGMDAVAFAYGPVMLNELLGAEEILRKRGIQIRVVNQPWLNRVDTSWLKKTIGLTQSIFIVEDHAPTGGLGDYLLQAMTDLKLDVRGFKKFAVEGIPACGTPIQALRHHRLDAQSLAIRFEEAISKVRSHK